MTWNSPRKIKQTYIIAGLGFLCACVIIVFSVLGDPLLTPWIERIDSFIYDALIRTHHHQRPQVPRVVIIDIDDKSIQQQGRWPWSRQKLADLIEKLKAAGVVTIGLDMVISEPELNTADNLKQQVSQSPQIPQPMRDKLLPLLDNIAPQVEYDKSLAKTLSDKRTVLGFLLHHQSGLKKGVLPAALVNKANQPLDAENMEPPVFEGYNGNYGIFLHPGQHSGFLTNVPDSDGTVRHAMLLAKHQGQLFPSLALSIAMHYMMVSHLTLQKPNTGILAQPAAIQLEKLSILTDKQGKILIPFWGAPGTLDYYSATDVLNGRVGKKQLEGTIAVIGSSMPVLSDLHKSPQGELFPGIEIVGNLVQGILGQKLVHEYHWRTVQGVSILFITGLFFAMFFLFLGSGAMLLVSFLTLLLIALLLVYVFFFHHVYIPTGWLFALTGIQMLVNFSCSFILERRQKQKISHLFGQYVPETYVKELIEMPGRVDMAGESRDMTVLFADIRNFTTISETLDASEVKQLLNAFFTPLTKIIFDNHGTIDKYVGDMIVAFWGAPLYDSMHTEHAINAALNMLKKLPEINSHLTAHKLPEVDFGIGMSAGIMNVGDMGSEFRRAYTVIGDTVNLASRLQDLTKFYQVPILVSETMRNGRDQYLWRLIDKVVVKGRHASLNIYQPICFKEDAAHELFVELDAYQTALNQYYRQDWSAAKLSFENLKESNPTCYLYTLYLDRIALNQNLNLPFEWNGVFVHENK